MFLVYLQHNVTVKRLDLSDTGIGIDGLGYILEMLDENTVITDIVSNGTFIALPVLVKTYDTNVKQMNY